MTTARFLVIVLLTFSIYSCTKEDVVSKTSPPDNGSAPTTNVNKSTLLQLVNQVRQSGCTCGTTIMSPVSTVTWNDQLAVAAYKHSNDMYLNNYFSHTALNGASPGDRIIAAGYNWRAYGENIAKGYLNEQSVMDGWLKSEGHCKNIMSPNFKEMGVARVGTYWAQEFGSK